MTYTKPAKFFRNFIARLIIFCSIWSATAFALDQGELKKLEADCSQNIFESCLAIAKEGYAEYQHNVGVRYNNEKDFPNAVYWFSKAAAQGLKFSQHNLGVCYLKGNGVAKDTLVANTWFRKAAEQGYPDSQLMLGLSFLNGEGVIPDHSQAITWLNKAAENGNSTAQYELAITFLNGDSSTGRDWATGMKWAEKCAKNEDINCQLILGESYVAGVNGLNKSPRDARYWLERAYMNTENNEKCKNSKNSEGKQTEVCGVAIREYAKVLELGFGGERDQEKARALYSKIDSGMSLDTPLAFSTMAEYREQMSRSDRIGHGSIWYQPKIERLSKRKVTPSGKYQPNISGNPKYDREFEITVLKASDSGWTSTMIESEINIAATALSSCGIRLGQANFYDWKYPSNKDDNDAISNIFYPNIVASFIPWADGKYSHVDHKYDTSINIFGTQFLISNGNLKESERKTLAHELGHVLGLNHPASFEPSLMQYGNLRIPKFTSKQCEIMRSSTKLLPARIANFTAMVNGNLSSSELQCDMEKYNPRKLYQETRVSLVEKNLHAALFCAYLTSAREQVEGINFIAYERKLINEKSGTLISADEALKLYEYAHNWRPGDPIVDENTKFYLKKPLDIFWLTKDEIKEIRQDMGKKRDTAN